MIVKFDRMVYITDCLARSPTCSSPNGSTVATVVILTSAFDLTVTSDYCLATSAIFTIATITIFRNGVANEVEVRSQKNLFNDTFSS
eukprot:m.127450 g.127450  ORF g.127450 m.127450 type:complete len:87 (+) comp29275_c1_seq1:539-799(+)